MRLSSIELITRKSGFFQFRDCYIPSVRNGDSVVVAVFFENSPLDEDFSEALGYEVALWFPSNQGLKDIKKALEKSDKIANHFLQDGGDFL